MIPPEVTGGVAAAVIRNSVLKEHTYVSSSVHVKDLPMYRIDDAHPCYSLRSVYIYTPPFLLKSTAETTYVLTYQGCCKGRSTYVLYTTIFRTLQTYTSFDLLPLLCHKPPR